MITTFEQHIAQEQQYFPAATGEFTWLMSGLAFATKLIQAKVRRAGLSGILGADGGINVQGEIQQKLDVYANECLIDCLSRRASIGIIASEENERPITVGHKSPLAKYAIVFDPLDGSSNIDVAVTIGTTFAIYHRPAGDKADDPAEWVLQKGRKLVAAGYVVYGTSTILVYSSGLGVNGFTLDPSVGAFILSHANIKMPRQGYYYSANEAYRSNFPKVYTSYLDGLRTGVLGRRYSLRFIGTMVADFHRTLLRGGVFLYPPTPDYPDGRLRLLYEANPIAFIAEQAGGSASNGPQAILDVKPQAIHQRTPLIVGSQVEMEEFARCWEQHQTGAAK